MGRPKGINVPELSLIPIYKYLKDILKTNVYFFKGAFDNETKVVKFVQDRSNSLNPTTFDTTDYVGVSTFSLVLPFTSSSASVTGGTSGFNATIDTGFTGISTNPDGTKLISLDTQFTQGVANPEINKQTGEIIYIDNRTAIPRSASQKEDIKIVLEF